MISNLPIARLPIKATFVLVLLSCFTTGCQTTSTSEQALPKISLENLGQNTLAPLPASSDQQLDLAAINAVRNRALTEGVVAARIIRDAYLVKGIDVITASIIDADIAWFNGNIEAAERLMRGANT